MRQNTLIENASPEEEATPPPEEVTPATEAEQATEATGGQAQRTFNPFNKP